MFKVPIHFPLRALQRIRHQGLYCSPLQSCQAEILINVSSGADILAWGIAQVKDFMFVNVGDANQILPYTSLELEIWTTSMAGGDSIRDWNIPCEVSDTAAPAEVTVAIANAINGWVQLMISQTNRYLDVASMRAIPILPSTVVWRLPWGMLGIPNLSQSGPLGDVTTTLRNPGVDNPFVVGIIQKRRHLMLARYPYRDDYYGDIPIG